MMIRRSCKQGAVENNLCGNNSNCQQQIGPLDAREGVSRKILILLFPQISQKTAEKKSALVK
jgi:hypothetical protein